MKRATFFWTPPAHLPQNAGYKGAQRQTGMLVSGRPLAAQADMPTHLEKANLSERHWSLAVTAYQETQKKIMDLDSTCFKIKGWAITIWTASSGFSVQQDNRALLLLFCCPIFLFWFVDISYKFFQEQFLRMSRRIEDRLIQGHIDDSDLPFFMPGHQVNASFFVGGRPVPALRATLCRYWHHAPYAALLFCSAMLFTLFPHVKS